MLLVVGAALVLVAFRALLPESAAENESADFALFYRPVAERLADGEGLTQADGSTALRYAPGYPVLLAAGYRAGDVVGVGHATTETVLTVALMAGAALLVHLVARRVFGRVVGWTATALWLLYPVVLWVAKQPNSEVPFMVLLYAAVLLFLPIVLGEECRARTLVASGVGLGLATLVRPAGLVLLVPFVLVLWFRRRGVDDQGRLVGALLGGFAVLVVPWCLWASAQAGHVVAVADTQNLDVKNGLSLSVEDRDQSEQVLMPGFVRDLVVDARVVQPDWEDPEPLGHFLGDEVRERPGALLGLVALKAARSWYATESFRFEGLIAAAQLVFLTLVAVGAVLARRTTDGARWFLRLALGITGATWLTTIVVLSIVRYLVPVLGLLAPFAAITVLAAFRRVTQGRAPGAPGDDPVPSAA